MPTDFNFWFITLLSFNLAKLAGFLVFSCLEVAYINPSPFVIDIEFFGEATIVKEKIFFL